MKLYAAWRYSDELHCDQMAQNEREIIEAVLAGASERFREIIEAHSARVFRIASKHVPQSEVEEVAHEIFIRAFRSLPKYKFKSPFEHWLSALAVRACYDFWRARGRRRERSISELSPSEQRLVEAALQSASSESTSEGATESDPTQDAELLELVLGILSPQERMVVTLVHLEGLSVREAAARLGWSSANVKVRAFRARRKMQALVSKSKRAQGERNEW